MILNAENRFETVLRVENRFETCFELQFTNSAYTEFVQVMKAGATPNEA